MPSLPAEQSNLADAGFRVAGLLRCFAPRNGVIPVLFVIAAAAATMSGFVTLAPNRLVSGCPIGLLDAAGPAFTGAIATLGAALLALSLPPPRRSLHAASGVLASLFLLALLAAAGQAAAALAAGAPAIARVSLGAGCWVLLAAATLALLDALQRAAIGPAVQLATAASIVAAVWLMAMSGLFDALSLAREFTARRDLFGAAMLRHIVLVAAAVGPAVAVGVPLGIAAAHRRKLQAPLFALLNLLQTIPSIALFGLLMVPLSALASALPAVAALGVGGVGPAPAIIALVLYALLPVVRNTAAGIAGVDPSVIDAARGMGLTRRQILWQVELPLALPLLLSGLRIVTVQAVGLAVVAALIGAGGLGSFVFEGLGQYAADLVLLGALPAIGLALAADFLLQAVTAAAARR